jgi:hypothetical protein
MEHKEANVIRNVHQRRVQADFSATAALLRQLASKADPVWPTDRWPPMRLKPGLVAGATGGHGSIRYSVESVTENEIVFRFAPGMQLDGVHRLSAIEPEPGWSTVTHTIEAQPIGSMRLRWPLLVGPLHDALIEDALDNIEAALAKRTVVRESFPARIRALRQVVVWAARRREPSEALRSRRPIALATSTALAAIAGVHLAWAFGVTWPASSSRELARHVVGTDVFPSATACLAVTTLVTSAAGLVHQRVAARSHLPIAIVDLGTKSVAAVLALRGAGGLVASGLLRVGSDRPFQRLDTTVYSPLCLVLAAGAWHTATGRFAPTIRRLAARADGQPHTS